MNPRESDSGTKLFALCMFIAVDIFKRQKCDFFSTQTSERESDRTDLILNFVN